MSVSIEKLMKMAEQITANLNYTDDTDIVSEKVANHLGRFWDPEMRSTIKAYALENPASMTPALLAAVQQLK